MAAQPAREVSDISALLLSTLFGATLVQLQNFRQSYESLEGRSLS